jgi:hypothetical protein
MEICIEINQTLFIQRRSKTLKNDDTGKDAESWHSHFLTSGVFFKGAIWWYWLK